MKGVSERTYKFAPEYRKPSGDLAFRFGIVDLTDKQSRQLRELLHQEILPASDKMTFTDLMEQHIDVGDYTPIRQRFRPVSPKV